MNAYFAYTRVSTVKQGERGSSLQEQKSAIEAYAAKNLLQIAGWYEEMETAAKQGRRMFNRMLADLETGRARGVLIHKIDRSARNLKDWAHLGELIDRGVEVHFAHESLDLASRGGRLSADIQAVVAADYIRNLRDEVKKGFYGRLKQGFYPLPAPVGYVDQGKARAKTVDPVQGPLVRELFELYATGRYSLTALTSMMADRGLRSRAGRAVSKSAIANTLHNPFYIGIVRIVRTGETFLGGHAPLVRAETFERTQAILAGKSAPRTRTHDFIFRRLVRCCRCGSLISGERQKGRVYYRCHTPTCHGVSLREDAIIEKLGQLLREVSLTRDEIRDLRSYGDLDHARQTKVAAARHQQHQRALALCEERLARLIDAFLDGAIEKQLFEERKRHLLLDQAKLRDLLIRPKQADPLDEILEKFELGNTAQQSPESLTADELRLTVDVVTSNFTVDGKDLVIAPRFPFSEVAKWRKMETVDRIGALFELLTRRQRDDNDSDALANSGPHSIMQVPKVPDVRTGPTWTDRPSPT